MEKKVKKENKDFGFLAFENKSGKTTSAHVWNLKKDNIHWK